MELFRCPLCGAPLTRGARVLVCPKRHSFDLAAEGYAHLLPAAQMHAKIPGDSREMVAARRRFLDTGGYACFSDGLNALVCSLLMELPAPSLVDAGCGEGYYTARLVQALRASGKTPSAAAFDISKFAVKAAARRDKGHAVQWAVASSFAIPVADAAADCLVDIFSPAAAQEFARVVKPGGAFVFAVPGPRHLYGLKEVLYERPYENTVQDVAYPGFALGQRIPVHSMLTVTGSTILDLFAMTPYYWKTPRSGAERLASLDTLTTELHFDFLVYRRAHA